MNALFKELAERIRGEISELDGVVDRLLRAWPQAREPSGQQEFYLDSIALNLHGFYSGLERLFELIARHMDHTQPAGETWHRDLLAQMAREVADVRPAVFSQGHALALDEFLRFRHLVRNVYTMQLVPEKVNRMMSLLPGLWPDLRAELAAFADFAGDLADQ